ncbi:hypothetical protein LZ30DRAFT_119864 [Colletotrichum cereale]|nr:hypothetical protein LZ30DRAFT_119864 [Colletotrichum cereale]
MLSSSMLSSSTWLKATKILTAGFSGRISSLASFSAGYTSSSVAGSSSPVPSPCSHLWQSQPSSLLQACLRSVKETVFDLCQIFTVSRCSRAYEHFCQNCKFLVIICIGKYVLLRPAARDRSRGSMQLDAVVECRAARRRNDRSNEHTVQVLHLDGMTC